MKDAEYLRAKGWKELQGKHWRERQGMWLDPTTVVTVFEGKWAEEFELSAAVAIQLQRDHDCLVFARQNYKAADGICGVFGCGNPAGTLGCCTENTPR